MFDFPLRHFLARRWSHCCCDPGGNEPELWIDELSPGWASIFAQDYGVRLTVPYRSLRYSVGPITLQRGAEVVSCVAGGDEVFDVMRIVRCLPTPMAFAKPLTLDFVVDDLPVPWLSRQAVRDRALREYQVKRPAHHAPVVYVLRVPRDNVKRGGKHC